MLEQKNMEFEGVFNSNKQLVVENLALQNKIEEQEKQYHDLKLAIKEMKYGNKKDMEDIKLMFLSKKSELVNVINNLKSKINKLNSEVDKEILVRDTLLHQE